MDERTSSPSDDDAGGSFFRRREKGDEPSPGGVEVWSALLLSVTVILTAWTAFESSKWGGAMSISFSQASSARVQANRAAGEVAYSRQVDLSIYSLWLQMKAAGNEQAEAYVRERFTDRFHVAFDDWVAQGGIRDPDNAPKSPFALSSYVLPGIQEAAALDARADAKFKEALRNNQRGDNYTILSVLFAVVLFSAAMAPRFVNRKLQIGMLAFASLVFLCGAAFLASFPKLV